MIAIVDYGVGNLFSLGSSLTQIGAKHVVTADPIVLAAADQIILPGVGAFGDAKEKLEQTGLVAPLIELAQSGKPLLGICLGMQLLFDSSEEFGHHQGLGLIPGRITSLADALQEMTPTLKVPHIGWNQLEIIQKDCPLLQYSHAGESFYYVHSFYGTDCDTHLAAYSSYGVKVPGVVANGNVFGAQFHPEKSGAAGLKLLRAFAEVTA